MILNDHKILKIEVYGNDLKVQIIVFREVSDASLFLGDYTCHFMYNVNYNDFKILLDRIYKTKQTNQSQINTEPNTHTSPDKTVDRVIPINIFKTRVHYYNNKCKEILCK